MACQNRAMAEKVVLYQELSADARQAVDEHVAQCVSCAKDLEILKGLVGNFSRMGKRKRETLVHPTEEEIIQYAVDARLLPPEQASQVNKHLQEDKCFECKRLYWSILDSEKQMASQPWNRKPEENVPAKFWQKFIPTLRSPVFTNAVILLLLSSSIWTLVRDHGLQQQLSQKERQMAELRAEQYEKQKHLQEKINQVEEQNKRLSQPLVIHYHAITLEDRRGKQEAARINLPKQAEALALTFNLKEGYRLYIVELFEETNRLVWQMEIAPERDTLSVSLHKSFLKKNKYELKLSGKTKEGKVESIAEIPLEIKLEK